MMNKPKQKDIQRVGVVIGRFQSPFLHPGHKQLFRHAMDNSDVLVVLLGDSPVRNTIEDPLVYGVRHMMVSQHLAFECDLPWHIFQLQNTHSNETWTVGVDEILDRMEGALGTSVEFTLYGGRDSFIPCYLGSKKTEEITTLLEYSGTTIRKQVQPECSQSFREGMVYAANCRYPAVFPTVDIAILNRSQTKVLLGRKPGEELWRFPGGFVDPTDNNLESAAIREAMEETSIQLDAVKYLGSYLINDWRYRGRDKIMTTFFKGYILSHKEPVAGDDLEEVKWFTIGHGIPVMPAHKHLLTVLVNVVSL